VNSHCEKIMRRTEVGSVDLPTVQAVREYRSALRAVRELQSGQKILMSETRREDVVLRLLAANKRLGRAREALHEILDQDEDA
jgi:hypothetical protein